MTEEFDTDATMGLKVNGSRVSWPAFAGALPQEMVKVKRFHPVPHNHLGKHVDTLLVMLRLGTANVTVGFAHSFRPRTNWLWTEVAGIAAEEAGGLLGVGDHSLAATRPDKCAH
eukprot:CAMPEP_0168440300 /NCGR_PEP_ID=MMETSP0228-20121227/42903_1 /TAXON_ID=133427 /ORGANISM="Protoceratium reticulatum, Strain CCCM 535 (=CCMP 1889)" /LENGTH=113 /DNA_ID=CAMNT_0008454589 /DNA_START=37 /DNA_END=378 /DNA_ORIENTATION=-